MSRFYNIVIGPEASPQVTAGGTTAASNNAGATWTNFVNGKADLGAQTVEFDICSYTVDSPVSAGMIKIWGPTKEQIAQVSDFNYAPIQVFAGMQNGLPLASAAVASNQQGLIGSGIIIQSFGNWQGVNQTLDFVMIASQVGLQSNPANISFNWKKGTPLADAIKSVITTAYPTFKEPEINISSDLVLGQDMPFVYKTMTQFGQFVRRISQTIKGGTYQGVLIAQKGNQYVVFDDSNPSGASIVAIQQQDMIGQVTWLGVQKIQFNTVMRADLNVTSIVTLPPIAGLTAITNVQSASNLRNKNTFSGNWKITSARHIGNSRSPDPQAWISTFEAISADAPPDATSTSATTS